jgi:hypothetical protein
MYEKVVTECYGNDRNLTFGDWYNSCAADNSVMKQYVMDAFFVRRPREIELHVVNYFSTNYVVCKF